MCRGVMSKAGSLCVCFSVMVAAVLWVISLHLCTTVLGRSSARNALIKSSSFDDSTNHHDTQAHLRVYQQDNKKHQSLSEELLSLVYSTFQ